MSEQTNIEWATSTGNPWIGCTKVSPGCANCYAAELDRNRFSRTMGGGTKDKPVSHWGKGAPRFRTKGFWKDALRWNEAEGKYGSADAPHLRPRIFPSLCDWLDDEVPIEWLADFLKLIHDTPYLDWLLLTKRPENFHSRLAQAESYEEGEYSRGASVTRERVVFVGDWLRGTIQPNVWIGTSVEDQKRADERIPALLKIPAKIRFLSCEPLLGPVSLTSEVLIRANEDHPDCVGYMVGPDDGLSLLFPTRAEAFEKVGIHWVITGGESGKGARANHIEWHEALVTQCRDAVVKCFVKQMGANTLCHNANRFDFPDSTKLVATCCVEGVAACGIAWKHPKGGDPSEWPENLRVRQFPEVV
jgi:protein gp37